jgi:hypothetical protein
MSLPLKLSAEMLAIMMIGDGALALLQPRRHMQLWNAGPAPWRNLVSFFEERPALTRATGAASIALGLWLASSLKPEEEDTYDHLGAEAHVPHGDWQELATVH